MQRHKRTKLRDRQMPVYTRGEERFNMISHIVGSAIGVAALVLCIVVSAVHRNGYGVAGSIVYGVSMIVLYTMSSVYHGLKPGMTAIDLKKYAVFSMICYLGIGWCIVFKIGLLIQAVGWGGFWLILMGGVCYTVGAVLYGLGRTQKYMHSVFHLFVIAGSVLHLLAILLYAL